MIENHLFAHCKLGTITAITSILLASTPSSASEVTIIVEENFWYGSGNWFNASNWGPFGNLFDLPDPHLNTYIGPQSESHPAGPAIIKNGAFYSPSHTLYMAAWDGISQITIGANGSLTINGLIGYDNSQSHYQPTNPIQPSTVILDDGEISGNWTFYENSRVILRTANPSDNWDWSGTIGTLVIGPNVDFSLNTASNTTIKNLVNRGTLELDNSSGNLLNGTLTNQGTINLESGTSYIHNSTISNLPGIVKIDETAALYLSNSVLANGNVNGTGKLTGDSSSIYKGINYGGDLKISGGTIYNGQINDTLTVTEGGYVSIAGKITNNGTLEMHGKNTTTRMQLASNTLLTGNGETVLNGPNNYILGNNTEQSILTIDENHTLRGEGWLGQASVGTINIGNRGTIKAEGTLYANVGSIWNKYGTIEVTEDSNFSLQSGTVYNGSVTGTGTLSGNGKFQGVEFSGDLQISGSTIQSGHIYDTLTVTNAGYVSVAGTITNDGTLTMAGANSTTRLMLAGNTILNGAGETVLGGSLNYIGSTTTKHTIAIGADQTLRGGGWIGSSSYGEVDVVNKGTVVADNGTLYTYGSTFNNAAGEIQVSSGAALYVQKACSMAASMAPAH
ncbi:hypothetical protein [Plasticicumulans sp.]|uniref:hypothetical protein n=1 Tax=Plasticicumulans sp. TaxID=2307179 RepID=UPI003944F888